MSFERAKPDLQTVAIRPNGTIDPRYTCDLDNSSHELRWGGMPAEAATFTLIVQDLDAFKNGTPKNQLKGPLFTHWLIYNIPGAIHHLPAGIPPQETLPNGILQG